MVYLNAKLCACMCVTYCLVTGSNFAWHTTISISYYLHTLICYRKWRYCSITIIYRKEQLYGDTLSQQMNTHTHTQRKPAHHPLTCQAHSKNAQTRLNLGAGMECTVVYHEACFSRVSEVEVKGKWRAMFTLTLRSSWVMVGLSSVL